MHWVVALELLVLWIYFLFIAKKKSKKTNILANDDFLQIINNPFSSTVVLLA